MARFEDFDRHERRVITEALEYAQSEFYDPGHTQEDRDALHDMIKEIGAENEKAEERQRDFMQPNVRPGVYMKTVPANSLAAPRRDDETAQETEPVGGFDRGGHPIIRRPDGSTQPVGRRATEKPSRKSTDRPQLQPGEHTGFLYVECAHCGHIHAFCAKQPIRTYRCEECGGRTPLIDMYPLRVACECGARFNYKTNIVIQQMDVTCYHCGAPVAVEWSDKWMKYQPISGDRKRPKGKKGGQK